MLIGINVKNLALIRESEIFLGRGLNILTGETGAGKSIILGSIRLALGERARADMIRTGEDYALVELIFSSEDKAVLDKMKELDIPTEADGNIYIQRRIMDGRSTCKCNGESISGKALKELASLLINIHGQNDTQTLLDVKNYMDILDDYGGSDIATLKEDYAEKYAAYRELAEELDSELKAGDTAGKDIALAQFELEEIRNARLEIGEDEELEGRYRIMTHGKKIAEALSNAYAAINGEGAASDQVGFAIREVNGATQFTEELTELSDNLSTVEDMLKDSAREMQNYIDRMDFSEQEFRDVETRLDEINRLKNKYGNSVEDVLKYAEDREKYIEKMSDHDAYVEKLRIRLDEAKKIALSAAVKLSDSRCDKAKQLQESMITNLKELNFQSVSYEIEVTSDKDLMTDTGIDNVDFLVSFNVGEPVRSLSQVASGGELSRFMLALKAVTADKDSVDTLIFDEIDAGISGATAWSVSEKMAVLAKEHQLIAITHLPQIAAMADSHYVISKDVDQGSTVTTIKKLSDEERLTEVARLMSTGDITEASLNGARELLDKSKSAKSKLL